MRMPSKETQSLDTSDLPSIHTYECALCVLQVWPGLFQENWDVMVMNTPAIPVLCGEGLDGASDLTGPADGLKQLLEWASSSPDMSMWVASPMLLVGRVSSRDPCKLCGPSSSCTPASPIPDTPSEQDPLLNALPMRP